MEIMVAKKMLSTTCEDNFGTQRRGFIACCSAMNDLVETEECTRYNVSPVTIGSEIREGKIFPYVAFTYHSGMPGTEQKVCPFCGKEHTVTVVETILPETD